MKNHKINFFHADRIEYPKQIVLKKPVIWQVPLEPSLYESHISILEAWETEHINRCQNTHKHTSFVCGHVALRSLLSHYSHVAPENIHLESNSHGKLIWNQPENTQNICFNITHSEEILLIVLAKSCEVGIDIEKIKKWDKQEQIARKFFHDKEWMHLDRLPLYKKPKYFYSCWTAKEAVLKAIGTGLNVPMDSFYLKIPETIGHSISVHSDNMIFNRLCAHNFIVKEGYLSCLATEKEPSH